MFPFTGYGLVYYCDTATVPIQQQLLTCKTSTVNGIRYYLKKLLLSNYRQKLNEIQYLKHFCD